MASQLICIKMSFAIFIRDALVAAVGIFDSQDRDPDAINPQTLAVATSGYQLQSQVLHIPDRYGFFSPGPSEIQALEGALVPALIVTNTFMTFLVGFIFLLMKTVGDKPNTNEVLLWYLGTTVGLIALLWVIACTAPHPRFQRESKLRKEL